VIEIICNNIKQLVINLLFAQITFYISRIEENMQKTIAIWIFMWSGNSLEAGFNWNESYGWILFTSTSVWHCKHQQCFLQDVDYMYVMLVKIWLCTVFFSKSMHVLVDITG